MEPQNMALSEVTRIVASSSPADKGRFKALWEEHLKGLEQGKIVYFIPSNMGHMMGHAALQDVAHRLRKFMESDVFIYFDVEKSAYRIGGPVTASSQHTLVYEARYQKSKEVRHVAKPMNAFLLFRRDKQAELRAENPDLHCSNISKKVGEMWQSAPTLIKTHYYQLAKEEKERHLEKNPGYKLTPRKPSDIKRRSKLSTVRARRKVGPNPSPLSTTQTVQTSSLGATSLLNQSSDLLTSHQPQSLPTVEDPDESSGSDDDEDDDEDDASAFMN